MDTAINTSDSIDFRALFEGLPGLYLVLDKSLRIIAASDAYLFATMRTREELVGRHILEAFPDNPDEPNGGNGGSANLLASLERVLADKCRDTMAVQKYDIRLPESSRPESEGGQFETRYWSPSNSPILHGDGSLSCIIHRVEDVTEFVYMKQAESEQHQLTIDLKTRAERVEAEVILRSQELQETNRQLRKASVAKSEFLSRMSHELRTPFTAVMGFGELLALSELTDEQHEMITAILKAAKHLLDMLDDILDISKIEAGHLSLIVESVAVKSIVIDALSLISPLAAAQNISIVHDLESISHAYVTADRQRLRQVLINLFSNAVKYNRPNGTVTVRASRLDKATARISVTDTGEGIAPEAMERLFTPFDRLGMDEKGIEGSGLGLTLSRQLAESMDATLSVESEVGVGTTFAIDLPLVEPSAIDELRHQYESVVDIRSYVQQREVLYVEDITANAVLVERILQRRPAIAVRAVGTGSAGLQVAEQDVPDLIILDIHLPDMEGNEVLRRLRSNAATYDIPVIVLSAGLNETMRDEFYQLGVDKFLSKPISVRDLLDAVDSVFGESPSLG